ncbi:glutathione S-transferase family protein [Celerinatantimonas sp. YJH-8]|uniref:glutathione S-transferase family protein n=1 Tax=Celerinatantimonas sp. YJH-8 TaxID=3228714 RepID=UPI0038C084B6
MKLYEMPITPNCLRVNLFIREKGIEIDREQLDVRAGDNLTAAFQAKSINGLVPVLELDSGEYLCESVAICRYLEALHPTPNLFGIGGEEQARIEMWQRLIEFQGIILVAQAVRNLKKVYQDRENCIEDWGHEALSRFRTLLPKLNTRLSQSSYLAGERFTIADISAFVMLKMASVLDIHVDHRLPALAHWQAQIAQRPAFQS